MKKESYKIVEKDEGYVLEVCDVNGKRDTSKVLDEESIVELEKALKSVDFEPDPESLAVKI